MSKMTPLVSLHFVLISSSLGGLKLDTFRHHFQHQNFTELEKLGKFHFSTWKISIDKSDLERVGLSPPPIFWPDISVTVTSQK